MRSNQIDYIRTIAILIMLTANCTPYLLEPTSPFIFRLICSLAAPIFIFLSGYTFAIKSEKSNGFHSGLYILISAVIVDCLAWGMPPFQTFDVLYLIALGQITLELLKKIPLKFTFIAMVLLILTPLFFQIGYRFHMPNPNWCCWDFKVSRWLFDGWFPVFPWLAFPIAGYLAFRYKFPSKSKLLFGLLLIPFLILVIYLLYNDKINQPFRDGYIELFYPASITYLMLGFLICFLLLHIIPDAETRKNNNLINFILLVGRHSLFVYLIHAFIISRLFILLETTKYFSDIISILIPFYAVVYLFAYLLEHALQKKLLANVPTWIKKPLGLY